MNGDRGDEGSGWAWLGGLLAVPLMLLCCGGPLLLALAASLGVGSWLAAHGMLLAGAVVLAAVVAGASIWAVRRGRRAVAECCPPAGERTVRDEGGETSTAPTPSARPGATR
ncbi:MAG TPA: hypothetical protein VFD01_08395 [Candidatus Dormibacteraeota bacterium]|jgi:protein-S-isoprenylcysteine O-methyltransferase Ste14|nr:hypothetical protein [Candidatus Dormibacteraeota bacterium]